jgi:bifunctional DNA-binding transcriptional regulator/antitoxin component of YhaV-PrlF toxin-antitoxin module
MMIAQRTIEADARLRAKNQLTLPEPIADALGAEPNDVLVFEIDPMRPDVALVHLVRAGFAGAMTGVYGTTDDVKAFIREEHAAWGE